MAKIRDEYYVNLKGKMHPVYAGVLVAAHEEGLLGIEVTILQYPTQENGMTAVCAATVTMKGDGQRELVFSEVGDASPANVGPMIVPHIIRMAATRAKGRALRDSIALGVALVEEMGGPDNDDPLPALPRDNGPVRRASSPPAGAPPAAPLPVARHSPGTVGTPPAPRRETPRPVVVAEGGAVCTVCGQPVTAAQATISQKHYNAILCPRHQRETATETHIRAQSTEAPA